MTDFLLHRTAAGVELIPRTHAARMFLEPHRLDGVTPTTWEIPHAQWPAFETAIQGKGLTTEEAS